MATNLNISENQERVPLRIGGGGLLRTITPDDGSPYYVGARAYVEQTGEGAVVTVIDKEGTTTATVHDGDTGADGYSPTATVSKSGGTTTITITDKNGTTTAEVHDGVDNVTDVKVDGSSVVSSGVATIPKASANAYGVVKVEPPTDTPDAYPTEDDRIYARIFSDGEVSRVPTLVKTTGLVDSKYLPKAKYNSFGVVKAGYNGEPPAGYLRVVTGINSEVCVPALQTNYTPDPRGTIRPQHLPDATTTTKGALSASDKAKLDGIESGAEVNLVDDVQVDGTSVVSSGVANIPVASSSDYGAIKADMIGSDPPHAQLKITYKDDGNTIVSRAVPMMTADDGTGTVKPYLLPEATQSVRGAMSASDKTKLDGIASGAEVNVQSNWTEADSSSDAFILNKPTIPTVNDATLTIQKNGTNVATFTANASSNVTANISVPADTGDLTNGAGFITSSDIPVTDVTLDGTSVLSSGVAVLTTPTIHNVPSGGTSGQVLSKASGTDYDLAWATPSSGSVTDVEVDGTSVVTGGVASIDLTGKSDVGHTHTKSAITDFPSLATVATSGDYDDLTDKPTIPSKVSDLNNDSGFITSPNVVYCTCSTAAATAAKVATIVEGTLSSLKAGDQAIVKFTNANGKANPKLKIGDTEAKSIMRYGTTAPSTSAASSWNAGSCVLFTYDGTYWQMANYLNTTYSEISQANITNGSGSSSGLVTGRRAKAAVEAFAPVKDVTVDGTSVLSGTTAAVDLSGKADASHTHTKSEITDFPALAAVATTGNYNSLTDKPAIHNVPSGGSSGQVLSKASGTDYDLAWVNQSGGGGGITDVEVDGTSVVTGGVAEIDLTGKSDIGHTHTTSAITDFPSLATVATSGSYNDLTDKPTIPTVNNATLTIQKNGTTVNTFTANASSNVTANITVPTVTDTYSGTSSDGMSGKAVKSAIDALDGTVSGTAGAGKTLTAFSQTDGKVSATFGSISITKSQVSDFPSLATVATSGDYGDLLNKPTFSGSTATKTPTEVKTAIDSGNFINITHLDPVYGLIQANNFNYSAGASSIVANVVFYYSLVGLLCFELIGNLNDDTWTNNVYVLAQTSDIPTVSKTVFTPTSGTNYANYGGCYYETYGNIVHIHIGVINLTANTATVVYNIPAAIRPASPIFAHGTGGAWNNIGYLEVQTSGDLYVRSQGTGCGADAVYLI